MTDDHTGDVGGLYAAASGHPQTLHRPAPRAQIPQEFIELADGLEGLSQLLTKENTGSDAGFDDLCWRAAQALRLGSIAAPRVLIDQEVNEALRLLRKISDLAYDEDVGEPLDCAIDYANKAITALTSTPPDIDALCHDYAQRWLGERWPSMNESDQAHLRIMARRWLKCWSAVSSTETISPQYAAELGKQVDELEDELQSAYAAIRATTEKNVDLSREATELRNGVIEECCRTLEALGARYHSGRDLIAHLRAGSAVQGPLVPWELRCQQHPTHCTAPECDCPAVSSTSDSPLMRAAEKAAREVNGWSDSKRQYAERATGISSPNAVTIAAMEEMSLPEFEDARVQIVYELLCETKEPPNPEEHWEGWLARRIVAAVSSTERGGDPEIPDGEWPNVRDDEAFTQAEPKSP